ncbi:hypothetical protein PF010_g10607 [Phytophthora fragariae]|uniref:Uncharacterized protein n=1 Tax=Phytophthora fragariae TaxID=53985 RepID=A0A6G0L8X7_9STRA|nr:hypothetical protein PF010_g10607 [Phytophthora fragariae]
MEEKPPAPTSKKHSGYPETAKDASASKKPADATEKAKEPPASTKLAKDAKKLSASKKPKVAATKAKAKANKTPGSPKPTRKTKKVTASSKPAPKKPVMKKPAAKQLPKKKGSTKESPKTLKLPPMRTDVLRLGPHEEVSSESSDTDIPNPGYVSAADSPAPRIRASTKDHAASANDATTSPPGRSPSPHPSLEVDYDESEPDMDHEVGEVERSPKQITDAQRVLHPGSPMSPKTVVAVERAQLIEASMSRRDDRPAAVLEPQVITNAGVDDGVPPDLLPDNRQHLADRTRQEASQAVGTKRDQESHAPRTKDQLLALRYWNRDEYREHLRQSRMPGPGASHCDKCPVVLMVDTGLTRQRNETELEGWLHHLGYSEPEYLNSPFRIDWLAQRRLRFRMAKMIADDTWSNRFFDRHMPMPGLILEEGCQKIQKSWQSQPIEPRSVLGPVSADQVRGHAQNRPRGRRSPPRGEPQAPTSFDYSGSHATSPGTGTDRYARGASVASRHGRGRPQRRRSPQREWCWTRTLNVSRLALTLTRRAFYPLLSPVSDCWMASGPKWWRFALASKMRRPAWRTSRMSAGTWTSCVTACGSCLGCWTKRLKAYRPGAREARRTTRRCARSWSGTLTGFVPCTTAWGAWRPKRHAA